MKKPKIVKSLLGMALALCLILSLGPVAVFAAEEASLSDFSYTLDEASQTVLLTKYTGTGTEVAVPGAYTVDGAEYQVVLDSATVFRGNTKITSVQLEDQVAFKDNSMRYLFAECSKLTSIGLSAVDTSEVTDMSYLFFKCTALKELDLSGLDTGKVTTMRGMFSYCGKLASLTGYENWDTGSLESMYHMFNRTSSLTKVDLRQWDLDQVKNTGWCFQLCYASEILLPDNLAVISAGFLNHAAKVSGTTYTIPAGVKKIGYAHTIYDFATDDFVEFIVADGNTDYKAVDGILYSMDGTEMLAVPRAKTFENNTYEIPEGVTFLGELSFSRNYNIHTLVLPDSYVIEYVPLYDPAYIVYEDVGNLNTGSNLTIAIYCYTGITQYAVKDSNPNYTSIDGIIYSKDMTEVVAIPARYAQPMVIPEGVTQWNSEAVWGDNSSTVDNLMANCSGVSIPASLTSIAQDQFDKLNRLADRTSSDFTITVDENNPVYRLDANGHLEARTSIESVQITLDIPEGGYRYDGTEKKPQVTVTMDTALTEGADYTVAFLENVNAGTASVLVTGMGDYTGTVKKDFAIAQIPLTITAEDQTIVYGAAISDSAFGWTENIPDASIGVTLTPSTANVTTSGTITPSAAKITVGDVDVTANYDITYVSGKLTIEPDLSKIETLTIENVTFANQADVEAVKAMMAAAETDGTDEETKLRWDAIIAKCDELLAQIEAQKVCGGTGDCPSLPFSDLNTGAWYHEYTDFVIAGGYMNGYSNAVFAPSDPLSRAMLVRILYNLEGAPAVSGEDTYTDTDPGAWYADAILWAQRNGLVLGYGNGRFGPDDPVTREQMAAIFYRYSQMKGCDLTEGTCSHFPDAGDISKFAQPAMNWAVGKGLLMGMDDGKLHPAANSTRAETAAVLKRFIDTIAQ